jgi:hypothetical protein
MYGGKFCRGLLPMKLNSGYYYNFVQGAPDFVGKLFKYQKCVKREMEGGELAGTFHSTMYMGSVRTYGIEIYSVRGNEVFLNYVKSLVADYLFILRPVVLKIPKKGMKEKWDASDEREKGEAKTIRTSEYVPTLKTALGSFQNVIKVTGSISFVNSSLRPMTKIQYYAKDVGLIRDEMGGGKDKAVIDIVKVENN